MIAPEVNIVSINILFVDYHSINFAIVFALIKVSTLIMNQKVYGWDCINLIIRSHSWPSHYKYFDRKDSEAIYLIEFLVNIKQW